MKKLILPLFFVLFLAFAASAVLDSNDLAVGWNQVYFSSNIGPSSAFFESELSTSCNLILDEDLECYGRCDELDRLKFFDRTRFNILQTDNVVAHTYWINCYAEVLDINNLVRLIDRDGDGFYAFPPATPSAIINHFGGNDCVDDPLGTKGVLGEFINPAASEICDGVNNDCDSKFDEDFDSDSDGYTDCDTDVNTGNYAHDCDPAVTSCRDDCTTQAYRDSDGDTKGNASNHVRACDAGTGYVSDNTDCDDSNILIWKLTSAYPDADGDGFGDETQAIVHNVCHGTHLVDVGYSLDNTDCNDDPDGDDGSPSATPLIALGNDDGNQTYPGNAEQCDNIDHDCDAIGSNYNGVENDTCQFACEDAFSVDNWGDHDNNILTGILTPGPNQGKSCCGDDVDEKPTELITELTCDGHDNNCNGVIDEGLKLTFYRDNDGDGLGDVNNHREACTPADLLPDVYVVDFSDGDDNDRDNDGVQDSVPDNCPDTPNGPVKGTCILELIGCDSDVDCTQLFDSCSKAQENTDGVGLGDACDSDIDGDGFDDVLDHCPLLSSVSNTNSDADGLGDACDNCPLIDNIDQLDTGGAVGVGDACDRVPVVNIPAQSILEDHRFVLTLSNAEISDPDLLVGNLASLIGSGELTFGPIVIVDVGNSPIDTCSFSGVDLSCVPKDDSSGTGLIRISVADVNGNGAVGTFALTVDPVNDLPTANGHVTSTPESSSVTIPITDLTISDVEDLATDLEIDSIDDTGTTGSVTFSPTEIIYDPDGNFEYLADGVSGTTEFGYAVNDTDGNVSIPATILVTITGENDVPVVSAIADQSTAENSAYSYQVIASDVDDGTTLTYSLSSPHPFLSIDSAGFISGTPTDNDTYAVEDVTVTVNDGFVDVTEVFELTVTNIPDAPTITSSEITSATEDAIYTYTFEIDDVDGDVLPLSATTLPGWLTFVDNGDNTGTLSGIPTNDEVGDHDVVLSAEDTAAVATVTQSFTITVTNTNDAPVANSDAETTDEDTPKTFNIVSNDDDDDGDTLTVVSVVQPSKGVVTDEGDGNITFDPNNKFNYLAPGDSEIITFTYIVNDGTVDSNSATVTITITGVNDAPLALPRSFLVTEEGSLLLSKADLIGDVDVDDIEADLNLIYVDVDSIVDGQIAVDYVTQEIRYNPNGDFDDLKSTPVLQTATETFSYTIDDPDGGSSSEDVIITINGITDFPTVSDAVVTVERDDPLTLVADLSTLVSENDGDLITWTETHTSDLQEVVISGTDLSVSPALGFTGTTFITLTANDGDGTDDGVLTVEVVPPLTIPTFTGISFSNNPIKGGNTLTIAAIGTNDADGEPVKFYCSEDALPTESNSLFATHPSFSFPYYNVENQFKVHSDNAAHLIYCRLYDGIDDKYSVVVSSTYDADSTPIDLSSVLVDGNPSPFKDASNDGTTLIQIIGENNMQCKYHTSEFDYALAGTLCPLTANVAECSVPSSAWQSYTVHINCLDSVGNSNDGNNLEVTWDASWNTLPVVSNLALTPSSPKSSNNLNVNYVFTDVDGDADNSLITWTKNGVEFLAGVGIKAISFTSVARGEEWSVSVLARDDETSNNLLTGTFPTIRNSAPIPTSASLSPANVLVGEEVVCSGTATDADGDSIVDEEFQFLINGVTAQPFSTDNTFTCSAPDCVRDKKLSCQYKAGDGIELSSLAEHSADLIVSNTPPTVTGAIISANSNPVTRESSITCTGQGMNDVDNDPNIVHYFQFYFDGVGRGGFLSSNSNTLTVNCADTTHVPSKQVRCVKGEPVHCEYYANDRPATSSVVTSSNVLSLVNAIPQANDLAISVDEDTSELISLDTYDADGDSLTVSVSQPAKGEVTNHNDGTVTFNPNNEFNYLAPGDSEIITFTYSVNDGTVDSSIGTVTLTVSGVNTPPTVTSSPITSATEDTIYSYTLIAGDVEGDALTISSTTLPSWLTLTDNGDNTATLVGTPLNEDVGSNSVSLLIEDAASSVTQVFTINVINTNDVPVASNQLVKVILPSTTNPVIANPTNHDELYAFFDFDDDDLDLESDSEILWYKDNVLQSVLGTNTYVVPPAKTANGENWHFTVRPGDGIGLGTLVTSNSVLIGSGNAPPLVEVSHISGTDFYDTLSIPFTYSDTNNDVLTFTLEESLDQLTWNVVEDNIASSPYSWSLPSRDGDTYIRISASDGVDSTVSNSVLVVLDNTCSCDSCASCELKLSRPTSWCSEISLTQSLSGVDTCIADPSNINGKTFDCDNNPVVGLNSGNFFELDSKSDVTIENCELSNFRYGFDIDNSNNIDIVDNTVSSTSRNNILISASTVFVGRNILHDAGSGFQSIYVSEGLNVNLENNEIYSCDEGIILSNSNSNIVNKNNIHDVSGDAISLFESDGNVISSNRLINNGQGINLIQSATNLIFDNYLSDNTRNAFDAGNNFWFTSPESGTNVVGGSIIAGNYWSDLTCNDAGDGICEEDYTIGVNIDEHPLVSS